MSILAIDPGPKQSAFVVYDPAYGIVLDSGILFNDVLLNDLRYPSTVPHSHPYDAVVIEKVESFGMAVGAEVFETVFWSGRMAEAATVPVDRIGRKAVKLALCGTTKAKDTNIRQALIDRFGGSDAIGRKATPGPLYGIKADMWAALAVAVAYTEGAH